MDLRIVGYWFTQPAKDYSRASEPTCLYEHGSNREDSGRHTDIPLTSSYATIQPGRLNLQAEGSSLLQSAQVPTIDDLELLDLKLKKAQLLVLAEESNDGESAAHELGHRETHFPRDNTTVMNLPWFDEAGWEPIDIFQDSGSDLSRDTSSDGGFSDTCSSETSSETSSDGDFSEAGEEYIDIDLLDSYEYLRSDLADNITRIEGKYEGWFLIGTEVFAESEGGGVGDLDIPFVYLILEALGTVVEDTPVGVLKNPFEGKVFLVTMLDYNPKTFFPMHGTRPKYVY
ncbi:uncharacterized protein RSE6_14805 [Rhynchosporium secalis]|uniref:Uncharacterized protein n=1 Tax=Rhynchosporium secalis TaxID=38038 RepID=A0A1E1MW86_RHYSE|nr:uncharacterized protein RSE6_14805 [Rhynchosporium secalis]